MTTIQNKTTTTIKKPINSITFVRQATKSYQETYDLSYDEFHDKLYVDGWNGKKIKDEALIKNIWDELVEKGCDDGSGRTILDEFDEAEHEDCEEEEDWDYDDAQEKIWEFITDDVSSYDCFPSCSTEDCVSNVVNEGDKCEECSKTPEEKKKDEEREARYAEYRKNMEEASRKRMIAAEAFNKEQEKVALAQKIDNAPEKIHTAILEAVDIFKSGSTEDTAEMKIKAMKNDARLRILDQMKDLVMQLKMISKW